jgi:hypothetical protein
VCKASFGFELEPLSQEKKKERKKEKSQWADK